MLFRSIPATYTDLVIVMNYSQSGSEYPSLQFNSDTGNNYSWTDVGGNGTSAVSYRGSNVASIPFLGYAVSGGTNNVGNVIAHINDYANTTTYKTVIGRSNYHASYAEACVGLWRNTAAISSITITHYVSATYNSGSTFKLYGIEAGNL